MNWPEERRIESVYRFKSAQDLFDKVWNRIRERLLGVDCTIFDRTIAYYSEEFRQEVSCQEAVRRALDKPRHKAAWYDQERGSVAEIRHFYREIDVYPFRQPFLKRFGGFRWYGRLVDHIEKPRVLEYGCGSAILTEYLLVHYSDYMFTVADIPSVTLDFVEWKKNRYDLPYSILEIGDEGVEVLNQREYDLIICQDVLEHTHDPVEIVTGFAEHLSEGGVLVVDFVDDPGGENLIQASLAREDVKRFLKRNLHALKAIDEPVGVDGLYVKA